jgi:REP element-mobilizing transposase RayT
MKRRKRIRLEGFDYSSDGLYFVTTCIKRRKCYFGKVEYGEMRLNEYGKIAYKQWKWLDGQYPYIKVHRFVVMPNHVHALIEINRGFLEREAQSTIKIKPITELMGAYKTTSSKQIHLAGLNEFAWQRSFHDSIVRAEAHLWRITDYIANNPKKWAEDCFFGER